MIHIGIDLGTSNTLAAWWDGQKPCLIEIDSQSMVPSVIYFEEAGGYPWIGKNAFKMWSSEYCEGNRCFRRWKLSIGDNHIMGEILLGGKNVQITPEYLTARMVEHVVKEISHGLGGKKVKSILVTVPHGWRREKAEKCRATRLAAATSKFQDKSVVVQDVTVSEPVAAAAYWIWEARRAQQGDDKLDLEGKTIMVCDVGGGTFDISLIRVGPTERPLDVIYAANNDFAGDFVDALICARVCEAFNNQYQTSYPTSPEELLKFVDDERHGWLRKWFVDVRNLKEEISENYVRTKDKSKVLPVSETFDDSKNSLKFKMTLGEFQSSIAPFYEKGKDLLRNFLKKVESTNLPAAAVFSGGGSKILGVAEEIVRPVLVEVFQNERKADACMNRITTNYGQMDRAIVLGAALIANGVVQVQERLMSDIGIIADLPADVAKKLSIPAESILLTPLLKRGSRLPATVDSKSIGVIFEMKPREMLHVQVVVDDDPSDPFIQEWEVIHPSGGKNQTFFWEMSADTDGVLTLRLHTASGQETTIQGIFERKRTGRARLMITSEDYKKNDIFARVTPDQVRVAIEELKK